MNELTTKIRTFINGCNTRCAPFVWTNTADQVLTESKPQRYFDNEPPGTERAALSLDADERAYDWIPLVNALLYDDAPLDVRILRKQGMQGVFADRLEYQ